MDYKETFLTALEEGDEEAMLHLTSAVMETGIVQELALKSDVFLKVCQRNMVGLADVLISHGADVNAASEWEGQTWTPLQLATVYGHASTVKLLLERGAELAPLCEEDAASGIVYATNMTSSPFYLASLHGHPEIVDVLTNHRPRLIKQDSVCSLLLAAACKGGNLDIVRKWCRPTININQPAEYVTSLQDCENLTALYAACEGGHQEVAEFLVKQLGAHLTRRVCERFPATVGAMLERYFLCLDMGDNDSSSLSMEVEALLGGLTLGAVMEVWLEPHLEALTVVDVSHNALERLPDLLPWGLPNLRRLDVSHNRLGCLASPPPHAQLGDRLIDVNLSHNRLTSVCVELFQLPAILTLNLSHNRLPFLGPSRHRQPVEWSSPPSSEDVEPARLEWRCSGLTRLDVSHNELVMLPPELSACASLTHLIASHNRLSGLPPPWHCPLGHLDLSHNELESVPASLDQFWTGSLRELHLDYNLLDQIRECLVKLCELSELTASHNRIEHLPRPQCWECRRLASLDLSHNVLGESEEERLKRNKRGLLGPRSWARGAGLEAEAKVLEFPPLLAASLQELSLAHNALGSVPPSLAILASLQVLDLSGNPGLSRLPPEMGLLSSLGQLSVEGCNIAPSSVPPDLLSGGNKTYQVISHLRSQLRHCQPCFRMKLLVMGPPERGKSTLISLLRGQRRPEPSPRDNVVQATEWSVPVTEGGVAGKPWRLMDQLGLPFTRGRPKLRLAVWELTGRDEAGTLHQVFMTSNTLYLLVWDVRTVNPSIRQLGQCLCNLRVHSPSSSVVVALTFADKLPEAAVLEVTRQVRDELGRWEEEYSQQDTYPHVADVCAVSCESKAGVEELRQKLCAAALAMRDACNVRQTVAGRAVPRSYLTLQEELCRQRASHAYLDHAHFLEILKAVPDNDILSQDDLPNALRFLEESGSLLHYKDELRGLSSLYILDPAWLGRILAALMTRNDVTACRMPLTSLEMTLKAEGVPRELNEQILQLLEKFDIAVQVADSSLLVPHRLPLAPPGQELPAQRQAQVARLYCLRHIPEALWSRLILRLLRVVLRFSQGHWFLGSAGAAPDTRQSGSEDPTRTGSRRGLQLRDGRVKYWRRGLCVGTGPGECVVESVTCRGEGDLERPGILITVQAAAESARQVFAILGVIADEVDDVVMEFYQGFQEINMGVVDVYALCPSCSGDLVPGRGTVQLMGNPHFKLQTCAGAVLHDAEQDLVCPVKYNCLPASELVPDLLLTELPRRFRLDPARLQLETRPLGDGATGTVVGGCYGGRQVAVKMFRYRQHHQNPGSLLLSTLDSQRGLDSGSGSLKTAWSGQSGFSGGQESLERATLSSTDSGQAPDSAPGAQEEEEEDDDDTVYGNVKNWRRRGTTDREESDNLKVYKAFVELRKEVAVLSKLRHPCVVEFVGACISPRLMVAMELCPLGSLRSVLQAEVKDRPKVYPHQVHDVCYPLVFGKDLTYKIVYQVAKGLAYLHKHHIIYRDLKTENILLVSRDLAATVNIKLSDYGISRFATAQGLQGLVGTPGYIAPEIIQGLAYNEKVDIFSFAMVMYEVMCGTLPFHSMANMNQITKVLVKEEKRPSLDEFCVVSHFPCLEKEMAASWKTTARARPSAATLVTRMQCPHFLSQHDVVSKTHALGRVTCMSIAPDMTGERQLLWLWEEGDAGERLCHIYNLTTSHFHLHARQQQGQPVTCAAKVGRFMWLGTQKSEIEMYGCANVGSPRCQKTISLTAAPTQILPLGRDGNSGSRSGDVYVGLEDGTIAVFGYQNPVCGQSVRRTPHLEAINWRQTAVIDLGAEPRSSEASLGHGVSPPSRNRWSQLSILSPAPEASSRSSHVMNRSKNAEVDSKNKKDSAAVRAMVVTRGGKELWVSTGSHVGVIDLTSSTLDYLWSPAAELASRKRRVIVCKSISSLATLGDSVYMAFYKSKTVLQVSVDSRRVTHVLSLGKSAVAVTRHEVSLPDPRSEESPAVPAQDRDNSSSAENDSDDDKESVDFDAFEGTAAGKEGATADGSRSPRSPKPSHAGSVSSLNNLDEEPPPLPPKSFSVLPHPIQDGLESLSSLPPPPPPRVHDKNEHLPGAENKPPLPPRISTDRSALVPPSGAPSSDKYRDVSYSNTFFPGKEDSASTTGSSQAGPPGPPPPRIARDRSPAGSIAPSEESCRSRHSSVGGSQDRGTPSPVTKQKSFSLPPGSSLGLAPDLPLYVSSLLVVEDLLWMGTSLGQVHVLSQGDPPPGYPSRHVATLPATWRPAHAAPARTAPTLEVSPVTPMAAAGRLVVTVSGRREEKPRSDVVAWQAFSLQDLLDKNAYWQNLGAEERKLCAQDSLETSAAGN